MAAHATNKTNLGSIKTAITTFEGNISLSNGDAKAEMTRLAKAIKAEIAWFEKTITGL